MGRLFDIGNQIMLYSIFAVSLNLLMGFAGQASIAHAAFGAIGGYTAAVVAVTHGWAFIPAVLLGLLVAGVVGLVMSIPALRLGSEYTILLTLSVAYLVSTLVLGINALGSQFGLRDPGPISVLGIELTSPQEVFPLLLLAAAVVFVSCWRMGESAFGRVLRALREDETATRALGKNTVKFKVLVFGATSAMAGLGGALWLYYYQAVSPAQWTPQTAITIIAMVVIGGTANLPGSILGAAFVVASTPILEEWADIDPTKATFLQLGIYGLALILVMMYRPEGILRERHPKIHGLQELPSVAEVPDAPVPAAEPADDIVLRVRGLRKSFGGIKAVNGVDLDLPAHRVTALIGPNGAGKSTLFGLFTGFIPPDEGSVEFKGASIRGVRPDRIAKIGLVRSFQDTRLFRQMTVFGNVVTAVPGQRGEHLFDLFARPLSVHRSDLEAREIAMTQLRLVGMAEKANTMAGDLAHGEQKLVAIARVLATGADVVLFDEPTSGIDQKWVDRVADTIRLLPQHGKTVCIVEHNLAFLERLDVECYFLEAGAVRARGHLRELMNDEGLRHAYFAT